MLRIRKRKFQIFNYIRLICFAVFILGHYQAINSQSFYFTSFGINNGMPSNVTNSIVQDKNGFIWIGTQEGVCRFDGYKMLILKSTNSLFSIPSNNISSLLLDEETIWVGTWDGLCTINTQTLKIQRVNIGVSKAVRTLYKDASDNILIGTSNGLIAYNKKTQSYQFFDTSNSEISHNTIRSLYQAKDGTLWIGTYDKINRLQNNKFTSYNLKGQYKPWLKNNLICAIQPYSNENDTLLWVGTETGLCLFNTLTGNYEIFNSKNTNLSNEIIKCIYKQNDSTLWLGTDFGLNIINTHNTDVQAYYHDPLVSNTISNNVIWEIFEDKQGQLWFITSNGISLLDNHKDLYQIHEEYYSLNNLKIGNQIRDIHVGKDGKTWLASIHGVVCHDSKSGKSTVFTDDNKKNKILLNNVFAIEEDQYGRIWFGTAGGLNIWDEKLDKMYSVSSTRNNGLTSNYINSFARLADGSLWLSAWEGGLFKVVSGMDNPLEMKFMKVDNDGDGKVINAGENIFYGSRKKLWFIDLLTFEKKPVEIVNEFIQDREISSIIGDKEGGIWLGVENMLLHYLPQSNKIKNFEISTGFQRNIIGLQKDTQGNIWAATYNSIIKIDISNEDYSTIPISRNSPLKSLYNHCATTSPEGKIYFGGDNGYIEIDPMHIALPKNKPDIYITNLSVNNQSIATYDSLSIIGRDIAFCESLILKHNQNSLSFEFSALDYLFPDVGQYSYRMNGYEKNWQFTPSGKNFAIYSNLSPGEYIFEVKGTDHFGVWGDAKKLEITIKRPIWLSTWFILLYTLLFLCFAYLSIRLIKYRRQLNHELRIAKLEKQHAEELFQAKQQFFTNISHEFRTPLSLILPPIQQMLKSEITNPYNKKLLKLASRNAQRLYKLVNQLLDFGKMESSKLSLNPSVIELIGFCKQLFNSFKDMARRHEINYQFISKIKVLYTEIDTEKFEAILFNLLSNAFKYTPFNGTIELEIEALEEFNEQFWISIKVTDSGIGIPKNEQERIFERFYQTSESKALNLGSGIGLTLVQEYVKLHNGNISVESELNKGSVFTITIPVNPGLGNIKVDIEQINSGEEPIILTPESRPDPSAKNILIIDDNEDILDYIELNLLNQYFIHRASNGKDGLELALKITPNLIVSDVMMPIMDGISLCSKIKENSKTAHIPVILLTAKSLDIQKTEAMNTGADMYITKPFDADYLKSCIESVFRHEQQLQAYIKNQLILNPEETSTSDRNQDEIFLKKVITIIENNISNPHFSVETISESLGLSSTHLYRRLKLITNQSTSDIIKNYRMQKAAQMLSNNEGNITEIMYAVGFSSLSSFSKSFKSVFQVSPSMYLATIKNQKL